MPQGDVSVKGGITKTKILYGPEAHKLALEFDLNPADNAAVIHRGQPVKLSKVTVDSVAYDVVVPATQDTPEGDIIGISIHEQDSAYKGSIVVATRGYAVVLAKVSGAVDIGAKLAVGNGETGGDIEIYDADDEYCIVHPISADVALAAVAPAEGEAVVFTGGTSEKGLVYGWALETSDDGDIIKVLVKN